MRSIYQDQRPLVRINRNLVQKFGFMGIRLITLVTIIPIVGIVIYIIVNGIPAISWEFLSAMPRDGMRAGGILPAVVGTTYVF